MTHRQQFLKTKVKVGLFALLLLAFFFRFYNSNWDGGHFFHPDERNIANAVSRLEFFSQLDPGFYAYGGFLIYLYTFTADVLGLILHEPFLAKDWTHITLIGRYYSAFFSTITLLPLFLLAEKLFNRRVAFTSALLYGFTVSSIQTAHFSITENLLTLTLLLMVYISLSFLESPAKKLLVLMGIILGISIATKTTGFSFALIPAVALFVLVIKKKLSVFQATGFFATILLLALGVFTFFSPFTFLNWEKFLESMRYENSVVLGTNPVVYTLQFTNTLPYLFQIKNLLWQMGPSVFLSVAGVLLLVVHFLKKPQASLLVFAAFPLFYFGYIGAWHTKFIRYMVPLIPFLLITAGYFADALVRKRKTLGIIASCIIVSLTVLWALAFFSIYTREQTRITASIWIYDHIPSGKHILTEHWDEGLPIPLALGSPGEYKQTSLEIYNPDNEAKIEYYASHLSRADYLNITTRRLYGTLINLPEKYPLTSRYYKLLFSGKLGYAKVAEFTSYPQLFGISISDDSSEETFQVYDHPKVMIFQNTKRYSREELKNILQDNAL